jgi:hypothetical protein
MRTALTGVQLEKWDELMTLDTRVKGLYDAFRNSMTEDERRYMIYKFNDLKVHLERQTFTDGIKDMTYALDFMYEVMERVTGV